MIDKCTFNISELENNLHIQKNLTVSANGIFNSGIILGNSNINPAVTELGTIRYSGLDIEGYLDGTWKSLTSGGSNSGGSSGSSKSNTFQLNNITQTATYLESIIGFSIKNSIIISQIYGNDYQIINSANIFDTLEINISHPNLSTNPLSYSLEIYIDNNLSQSVNITIPQNASETILRTITNLIVQPNNKLQLKIKALDSVSEGGDIFISLHNINTTTPTPVENRITSGLINSDVFQLNSITQSYNNLETIIGLSLHSTVISQAYIKDYQIITNPNIYNILEVNISHSNLITNSLSYNLEIYINNSVAQTVNISIPQNSIQTVLVSISELEVKQNDKLQLKLKANDVISEGGNIFISLHGKNIITTTTTSIQDNFSIGKNLTVSGNGIFNDTINVEDLSVSNKIGIGTSTVETSLDIDSSLKVFDVLNNVSGYINTSDGDYMKLQATSRTDTSTKKNILLNPDGGNVGIGTNNPSVLLHIYNSSTTSCQVGHLISEGNSTGLESTYIKIEKGINYGGIIGGYLYQTVGGGLTFGTINGGNINHHQMVLNSAGNLGIGTTDPTYKLDVNGTALIGTGTTKIQLKTDGGAHATNAIIGNSGNLHIDSPQTGGIYLNYYNTTKHITHYSHAQFLGSSSIYRGTYGYLRNLVPSSGYYSANNNGSYSLYTSGSIAAAGEIHSISDERIKKNIVELVDNEALLKFRQLKPCKYNYIDEYQKGDQEVYGFIAQEVNNVLPYAVNIISEKYVPNIYKSALHNNNIIIFDTEHNLDSDNTVKLIISNEREITVPYTIVDNFKITINVSNLLDIEKPSNDLVQDEDGNNLPHNIFVYGTQVNDLHNLNKDAIWTTAAAALQEVDRIQQADAVKIQTLETNVSTLETKNTELETEVSNLKTQLADILSRLSALENN